MRTTRSCCCCEALDGRFDRRWLLRSLGITGLAASLPISARAAEGEYDAMLLSCIDPRMVAPVYKYMQGRGLSGKYSQFCIAGAAIAGKAPGPQNAAAMAGDLANVQTGGLSGVLATAPNGNQTSTLRTFNSLANMLVPCVRAALRCGALFRLAARVVRLPELVLEVEILPALLPESGVDRRELARRAELAIAAATGVPAPASTARHTPGGPVRVPPAAA